MTKPSRSNTHVSKAKPAVKPSVVAPTSYWWLGSALAIAFCATSLQTVVLRLDQKHNFLDFLYLGASALYWPLFILVLAPGHYFLISKKWLETFYTCLLTAPAFACTTNLLAPQNDQNPTIIPDTPRHVLTLTVRYALILFALLAVSYLIARAAATQKYDRRTVVIGMVIVSSGLFALTIPHKEHEQAKLGDLYAQQQVRASQGLPFNIYIPATTTIDRKLLAGSGSAVDKTYEYQFDIAQGNLYDISTGYSRVLVQEIPAKPSFSFDATKCTGYYDGIGTNNQLGQVSCEVYGTVTGIFGSATLYHIPLTETGDINVQEQYVAVLGSTYISIETPDAKKYGDPNPARLASIISSMVVASHTDLAYMQQ